jgi:predicted amidohydrolase
MRSTVIVATVQQQMRVSEDPEAYAADVKRFMRQVKSKRAEVVVFPELSGLMLAFPLISGVKRGLLKQADRGGTRRASPLAKVVGRVAGTTAGALGGGMQGSLTRLFRKRHGELFDAYVGVFSDMAAEYGMYIVGGSVYLYDEYLDEVRNTCYVFDPRGDVVGYQEKLVLTRQDEELCSPGDRVTVLPTEFGRLGVIIGSDVLYPEPARALAVQGADVLVAPAACPGPITYQKVRDAFHARVQENQLFGAVSFLVGPNSLGSGEYGGRSAVLAPVELAARRAGVLQEVGAATVEGFVAAECDLDALQQLWETADPPLRHRVPLACGPVLAGFYEAGVTLSLGRELPEEVAEVPVPALPTEEIVVDEPTVEETEEAVISVPASMTDAAMKEDESPGEVGEWPFESTWDEPGSKEAEDGATLA